MLYTVVEDDYCVTILRSVQEVYNLVKGRGAWLDQYGEKALSMATLRQELRDGRFARIHAAEGEDWVVKVQRHDAAPRRTTKGSAKRR